MYADENRNNIKSALNDCLDILQSTGINTNFSTNDFDVRILIYFDFNIESFTNCNNVYIHIKDKSKNTIFEIDIYKGYCFYNNDYGQKTIIKDFENLFPLTEETMFQYSTLIDTLDLTLEELNIIMFISLEIPFYES